ncbi:hypothetical protein NDA16_000873 [Ustilago loliicola]|nr:hypothetical protein NDA16_000873 [Ustilago loliicola]
MLREAFYYLLGGVTFLPLCILGAFLHSYFNAPSTRQTGPPSIEADVELTHEKKLAALDLAARNAALHAEIENAKGKDHPQGDATVPPTAKRLGPGPAKDSTSPKPFSSGWLTVRPTFDSDKDTANTSNGNNTPAAIPASLVEGESDPSQMHSEDEGTGPEGSEASVASSKATAAPANAGAGYMSQMYRGILDYRIGRGNSKKPTNETSNARSTPSSTGASATPTGTAGKENFFCILKSPILYLYSSDDTANPNTECHAAIDLRGKRVSIFVAGLGDTLGDLDPEQPAATQHRGTTTDDEQLGDGAADQEGFNAKRAWKKAKRAVVRDGELFMKRNAIRIVGSASERKTGRTSHLGRRRPQWFIFCKNNYVMEDWYHALLQASLLPDSSLSTKLADEGPVYLLPRLFGKLGDPIGPTFSQQDMASLLVSLDSLPDPLPLRWLNALVGRIFFSIYRTAWLEDYIISKMMKKINRVKTPGFLGDIKVEEVDVGRRAPGFSRPMLKALTSEGEASMEVVVHYVGEIRITISTTLTLSLGARFKPYNIPIVLAVVLRSLEGNLLLHVKRPPSNRLWFGFTTMPKMEIDIEPVVSERKVQWGMVTRLIEGRLKELLNESIVVPNMDDISFFDTRLLPLRGGIFADAAKKSDMLHAEVKESSNPAAAATATSTTQQERDAKSKASSIKTSDLLAANKVGAVSAPVSGAATPVTPDRAHASTPRDGLADEDGETSSIKTSASSNQAVRNRKAGAEPSSISLKEPSLSAARTSSPAAAGLSDLLSRDLAAGGGSSLSGSPPRQDPQSTKRRTWFGSGPKSSVSSVGSSSGLSSLGIGTNRSMPRQDAASALSSVQRSRYGLNESDRGAGESANALAGTTSAMLLTSWNKAKASMADKDTRQAAARDAKDAIKRGWANWNLKRAEAKQRPPEYEEFDSRQSQDGMTRSQSSRLSLVPGKSAWLASSLPDPTSFGLGFDKSSPEDSRSSLRNKDASVGYYARNNLTDTDDDNVNVHSNSSNRQPYRELRASKKVHGFDGALPDQASESGRGSSVSSSKLASTASLATPQSNRSTSPGDSQWDAEIPSLTPPAPAFHEKEAGAESKRRGIERTTSNEASPAAISPPALPQRKPSSSISSTGQSAGGGIVSFIPPAPSATTELASTSSLSAKEIEAIKQDDMQGEQLSSSSVNGEPVPAAETSAVSSEPRTPDRRVDSEPKLSPSNAKVQTASQDIFDKLDQGLSEKGAGMSTTETPDATAAPTEANAGHLKETPAPEPESSKAADTAGDVKAAEKTPSKTEQAYSAIPPEVSSPSLSSGIKKQPGRATMMAVPGIPSMQKAGPQSFSAPPPAPEPVPDAETSPASAFRASSLFKMPSFGSPILTGGAAMKSAGTKAEGPAADPEFEQAQKDAGQTIQIGSKEVKGPSAETTSKVVAKQSTTFNEDVTQ